MKRKIFIGIILFLIIILASFAIHNNRGDGYRLTGNYTSQSEQYLVSVYIMRNKNSNLLTYHVDVPYSNVDVNYAKLYYYEDNEKRLILSSGLSSYGIDKRGHKEFEDYEYVGSKVINHIDMLYMDLYLTSEDLENDNVYRTIELQTYKFS